jgi:hypothetical protein
MGIMEVMQFLFHRTKHGLFRCQCLGFVKDFDTIGRVPGEMQTGIFSGRRAKWLHRQHRHVVVAIHRHVTCDRFTKLPANRTIALFG